MNNKYPILTVSIAGYNIAKYIDKCMSGIIDERFIDKLEVFIVNDGSSDDTLELAKYYEKNSFGIVKVIDKENGGWGSTVNSGIKFANGKYFKLLDGDDFFDKNELSKLLEYLEFSDSDMVYTDYNIVDAETYLIKEKILYPRKYKCREYGLCEIDSDFECAMHACTFKTCLLKNNVFITEKCFYTDVEYVLKSLKNVSTVSFFQNATYQYCVGVAGQSMSIEGLKKHYREHYQVLMNLLEEDQKLPTDSVIDKIFEARITSMVGAQYNIYLMLPMSKEIENELHEFDAIIKKQYKKYYKYCGKRVWIYRIIGRWAYKYIVLK